jgi:hypothetical protein
MPNQLAQNIIRIISVATGEFVAKAMVERNCRLIGTKPEALSYEQLPRLADTLEESLRFFADQETARKIASGVRAWGNSQGSPKSAA